MLSRSTGWRQDEGMKLLSLFLEKISNILGVESGLLLGVFQLENFDVVQKHSRSWLSDTSQILG